MPCFTAESSCPIITLEFNYRDGQCLAGGLSTGQVAYWDMRKGPTAVAVSDVRSSHRDPVRSVYWIHSKTNTEFYSGSSDGQVQTRLKDIKRQSSIYKNERKQDRSIELNSKNKKNIYNNFHF